MRHPSHVWTDPEFASEPLDKLRIEYVAHLKGRSQPAMPETVTKYDKALLSLQRSLERHGQPLVLDSITPANINVWISEQRKAGRAEAGIASRLGAIKVFTNNYLFKHLEVTTRDLLIKVARITPPDKPAQVLTEEEVQAVLDVFNLPSYEDIRNRALVAVYIATGLRLKEVLELPYDSLDRVTGEVKFIRAKGNTERSAYISAGAMRYVKAYLRIRPQSGKSDRLWLQAYGRPLSLWGAHSVMKRLRVRCGIVRIHWHLFRHGFAQHALKQGADIGTVQEMLGHTSNIMTKRYAGHVHAQESARKMPKYAPI